MKVSLRLSVVMVLHHELAIKIIRTIVDFLIKYQKREKLRVLLSLE